MNDIRFSKLPIILMGLIASCATLSANLIFDGGSVNSPFGSSNAVGTLDSSTWSPNSSVEQSYRIDYTGNYAGRAFRTQNSAQYIAPSSIDWNQTQLHIDYRTSDVTAVYRIRLLAGADINIGDTIIDAPSLVPLVADGNWNTLIVPISGWTDAYTDSQPGFDPNVVGPITMNIQNHEVLGTVYFDNARFVTAVPEPSTVALLMGLAGLGGVVFFRRKRKA